MGRPTKIILKRIKELVHEESIDAFISYNVEFEFLEFDGDVETVYVLENPKSPNLVEHHMLENLSKHIKAINPRYRVGIMFEQKDPEAEEFDEFKQSYAKYEDEIF